MPHYRSHDAPAITFEQFSELKKAGRAELSAMPPDEAQAAVDGVLHPRLWEVADPEQLAVPGSLPHDERKVEPMPPFAPEELAAVFRSLAASGWNAVLIGGQAVNLWASRYESDSPAWRDLRPFASVDLDYYGGLADARLAMRALGATGSLNTGFDRGPNAAVLKVRLPDGCELLIDVLTSVYGVSSAEIEHTAVTFSGSRALAGLTLRVIHPLLLLEGKAASLRGLPQADRQDAKHLRILGLVVRQWLQEQLNQPRAVFRAAERLAACAAAPDGLHAFAQGIDLLEAIPLDEMRVAEGFETFFEQRLPQLLEKATRNRQRHLDALRDQ